MSTKVQNLIVKPLSKDSDKCYIELAIPIGCIRLD